MIVVCIAINFIANKLESFPLEKMTHAVCSGTGDRLNKAKPYLFFMPLDEIFHARGSVFSHK